MEIYIYLALFSPLVGSLISAFFAMTKKTIFTALFTSFMILLSMLSSLYLFYYIYITDEILILKLFDWINIGNLVIPFSFMVDNISVVMMCVITIVSSMVHIYSIGYMEHDEGFNRYFSYLSAFVFSMLILVMADNFAVLFIGWEGVGLCSWLLIGFWYEKPNTSWSANEAFIMNRIGDMGLLLAIFLLYWNLETLQYDEVFADISTLDDISITLIAACLFLAAMGKSAQFPLHTWLADAMEGPTPVSALIHAATMVTAGVYLIIRANQIYILSEEVSFFIACLGAFVAIFAASMALVNNDMKRIIAYSTLSQLGYMFVSVGLGAYWVALFHLTTHAFFKSVLFLGAGNVMHAMNDELDIRKMPALHKKMKYTSIIMIISSLALCGIFPLSGFFSKDKILETAFNEHQYFIWLVLLVTAFLTAFYSFRLIMKVFFIEGTSSSDIHPHEAKTFVISSMLPLVALAVIFGLFEHQFIEFTTKILPSWEALNINISTTWILILVTSSVSISGILFAIIKYRNYKKKDDYGVIHNLLINQYYIPSLYHRFISKPYYLFSCWVFKVIETKFIDGNIDGFANFIYNIGNKARAIQSGNLSDYLKLMSFALVFMLFIVLILLVI